MRTFSKQEKTSVRGSSLKRISSMETPAIKSWFDTILMGLGSSFDKYRYQGTSPTDVTEHLNILNELWKEIQQRENIK